MKVLDTYNAIIGAVIAVLSYIFGEHWMLFALFLAFNVADWLTGWGCRMAQKENSAAGWKGVLKKKLGYWLMIAVAFGASAVFLSRSARHLASIWRSLFCSAGLYWRL